MLLLQNKIMFYYIYFAHFIGFFPFSLYYCFTQFFTFFSQFFHIFFFLILLFTPSLCTLNPMHGRRLACLCRKTVAMKSDHIRD
jgi:hypothetical protein